MTGQATTTAKKFNNLGITFIDPKMLATLRCNQLKLGIIHVVEG